jgi:hypothetical protein
MDFNFTLVSTCPKTKCPLISSPTFSDFSRLIFEPTFKLEKLVHSIVSFETSKLKYKNLPVFLIVCTVRQIPLQQIELPSFRSFFKKLV